LSHADFGEHFGQTKLAGHRLWVRYSKQARATLNVNAPLTIRAVTSLEEFKSLAQDWERLLRTVPGHSLFLTWEWLYIWTKHFLGDRRLRILLMLDDQEHLVGIAPLYLRTTRAQGLIPFRELRLLGSETETIYSSYLDVIAKEKQKRAVLQSLNRYLFNEARGDWDVLTLSEIPAESSTIDLWNELCHEAGKPGVIVSVTCCPVIRLPGDLDTYRAGLGRSRRYTLQRKRKCLQGAGRIEYSRATCPAEVDTALDWMITLHQRRWNTGSSGGVCAIERTKRFHREIAQVLSERGRVSIDLLKLDDRLLTAIYGFIYRGVYYSYLPGFDPAAPFSNASPGLLLLSHCIEQAICDGAHTVDLLMGAEPYKLKWSNDLRRTMTLRYYNRNVRALGLKLLETAKQAAKMLVR
jgi:CelD/BcsL family acetyltransferase involved in cellulose biosynthesis